VNVIHPQGKYLLASYVSLNHIVTASHDADNKIKGPLKPNLIEACSYEAFCEFLEKGVAKWDQFNKMEDKVLFQHSSHYTYP